MTASTNRFNIEFDYRFAPAGAFDENAKQRLEDAAKIWESFIADDFPNIPAGTQIQVRNPQISDSNNSTIETITLDREIDDLLIFIGVRDLAPPVAAFAGPVPTSGSGFDTRFNGSNFEPWTGSIIFDLNADGSAYSNLSVNLHEIGHILGLGTAPIFKLIGQGGLFDGPNTLAVNGGNPVPLDHDLAHVQEGFDSGTGSDPVMETSSNHSLPSLIDLALLADIGYEIPILQSGGTQPPKLSYQLSGTPGKDTISGMDGDDRISGGNGNDTLWGESGNDTLRGGNGDDRLWGGAGRDAFVFGLETGNDNIYDFAVAEDTIQVSTEFGFTSTTALLSAVKRTGSGTVTIDSVPATKTVSELTLSPGQKVIIWHDAPLTENNFVITGVEDDIQDDSDPLDVTTSVSTLNEDDILVGTAQADILNGQAGSDRITGLGNNDRLIGGADDDHMNGGAGRDFLRGDQGSDRLYGGIGNDQIQGGDGSDRLYGGRGNDRLVGGLGRDVFVLEKGIGSDVIRDFQVGQDSLGLGQGLSFNRLDITQSGRNTIISFGSDRLATLVGIQANRITNNQFAVM